MGESGLFASGVPGLSHAHRPHTYQHGERELTRSTQQQETSLAWDN
ncbi:MAG TPA: hypothetical protein VED37_13315 [Ktedonobacteraceae bacterium]|nr:hypothetical protein [Ktedonobacteraceae bacterium]